MISSYILVIKYKHARFLCPYIYSNLSFSSISGHMWQEILFCVSKYIISILNDNM